MSPAFVGLVLLGFGSPAFAEDPPAEPPAKEGPTDETPPPDRVPDDVPGVDESALFGGPPAPVDEAALFGADPAVPAIPASDTSDAAIAQTLDTLDQRLEFGGQLWLQAQASFVENTEAGAARFASPNVFDFFADARPNDRVRVYARARVTSDFTVEAGDTDFAGNPAVQTRVILDQMWVKGDIDKKVFVTLGYQRIKWGTGRFWNPTDYLNVVFNPLSVFDVRTGVPLLKFHVPVESAGLNFYGIVAPRGARRLDEVGGALRAEWFTGSTEITLSTYLQKDQPLRFGGDLSTALGPFDVRVESSLMKGTQQPYYEGQIDLVNLTFPTEKDRSEEWIPQVDANAEISIKYSDEDVISFGAEYFYNGAGYDGAEIYPWLLLNNAFQVFYLGRHYGVAYVRLAEPGPIEDMSFTASVLSNLSDQSAALRFDWRWTTLSYLNLNAFAQGHVGQTGELRFGIDLAPMPGLEDGLVVERPVLDVGLGAQVSF